MLLVKNICIAIRIIFGLVFLFGLSCNRSKSENRKTNPIDSDLTKESVVPPRRTAEYVDIEQLEIDTQPVASVPNRIDLKNGDSFTLQVPKGFAVYPAAEGLPRVRFFAKAPDGRLFVTGLHTLADNNRGKVYILEDFNPDTRRFEKIITWKDQLRNPNSVAFYSDPSGQDWLYLAVTDSLVRYKYRPGEIEPSGPPEKIVDFPGYGLNYKYGGWHLTRTIAIHQDKLYVSVGSSCNLCEEKPEESSRAAILTMAPGGTDVEVFATGVRNAVDIGWVEGKLYGTNMASDHLGWKKPNDHFYQFQRGKHYGWPYCYEHGGVIYEEDPNNRSENRAAGKIVIGHWKYKNIDCADVPRAYTLFEPHGSPLGFAFFGPETDSRVLQNYFLAALHGPTKPRANLEIGHQIVRFRKGRSPEPVIEGFFEGGIQHGRPCDVFQWDGKSFFFTDDHKGVVYYVEIAGEG